MDPYFILLLWIACGWTFWLYVAFIKGAWDMSPGMAMLMLFPSALIGPLAWLIPLLDPDP